ncbi:uncharacterized protein [Clytia hemisphaerica]|uniref:G-protein coupled receptors family 1 profile domain-containing protein n=1 Tax=Clytia hemisphaerica TaxID=252671 RepID=A0A7M5XCW3_9CNID|eukprot:TCONS_00016489-protein
MIGLNEPLDIAYTTLYIISLIGNLIFILYLLVQQLKISVDRLLFTQSIVQLILVILAVPFVHDAWVQEPYQFGDFACRFVTPLHDLFEFSQGFMYAVIGWFIAQKLKGDQEIKWKVLSSLIGLHLLCIVFLLPTFGVWHLVYVPSSQTHHCKEAWSYEAEIMHRISRVFLFAIPTGIALYYYIKGFRIVKFITNFLSLKKSNARYQSFAKVISDVGHTPESHLCFGESEEMNLEMNHLYQKHNSISTISKDDVTANISVQIFTNEVEIDRIDSQSPLWRGKPKAGEYQKMVVSIKWFRYTRNLYQAFLVSVIFYAVASAPYFVFLLYTTDRKTEFTNTEKWAASIIFFIRYSTCLVNPWIFMLGIFKFRKSLFGKCYRQQRDFVLLPDSVKEDTS